MRQVILHIGHPKTGSSAIQAFLARNADTLRQHNIHYPDHPANAHAAMNLITSGNLSLKGDWLNEQVVAKALKTPDGSDVLFSCETIYFQVAANIAEMARLKDRLDIRLLLIVREPFEQLQSVYQQMVKRGGEFGNINDMASQGTHIEVAAEIVRRCQDHQVPITLLNYSAHRHDIIDQVLLTLPNGGDLAKALASEDRSAIVNRSLSVSELNLIREINRLGKSGLGMLVSDCLVNELPMVPSDRLPLTQQARDDLMARVTEPVRYINTFMPETEHLTLREDALDASTPTEGGQFSRYQLQMIAKCLHHLAVRTNPPPPSPRRNRLWHLVRRFLRSR